MKTIKVNVLPDPIQGPGYAIIALEGSSIESAGDLSFSITRNQDGRFLSAKGQWEPSETWHQPQEQQMDGVVVRCWVGTPVVDALLANPQMQYRILVKAAEETFQGTMRLSTKLFASSARVAAPAAAAAAFTPPPEPVVPVAVEAPVIEAAPAPLPTTSPKKSMVLPLVMGLVALAVIGAGLWWFLSGADQLSADVVASAPVVEQPVAAVVEQPVVAAVVEPVNEPVIAVPCSVDALAQTDDDIAYLQRCVQSTPSTEQVLAVIAAGKAAQKCDLIQRLYAHAAQTGNSDVALAYAKEFDPLTFSGGCFGAPEPATAVYWYELYLQQMPDDQAIATRAKSLKE